MVWYYFGVIAILLTAFLSEVAADDDEEECLCVLLAITDNANPCDGDEWKDAPVNVELNMEKKGEFAYLQGHCDVGTEVSDGYQMNLNVNLETPNGKELAWTGGAEICKSLGDEDAPWKDIVGMFNTTECPIPIDKYPVPGLLLNLDFAKGCLTSDFCGTYSIAISIEHGIEKIMCFEVGAEIYEEKTSCKYCPDQKEKK